MLTKEWVSLLEQHGGPRYTLKPVKGGLRAIHLDGSPFMTPVPNMFDWEARIAEHEQGARRHRRHLAHLPERLLGQRRRSASRRRAS